MADEEMHPAQVAARTMVVNDILRGDLTPPEALQRAFDAGCNWSDEQNVPESMGLIRENRKLRSAFEKAHHGAQCAYWRSETCDCWKSGLGEEPKR